MDITVEFDLDLEVFTLYPPAALPTTILPGSISKIIATVETGQLDKVQYFVKDSGNVVHTFTRQRIFRTEAEAQAILDIIYSFST